MSSASSICWVRSRPESQPRQLARLSACPIWSAWRSSRRARLRCLPFGVAAPAGDRAVSLDAAGVRGADADCGVGSRPDRCLAVGIRTPTRDCSHTAQCAAVVLACADRPKRARRGRVARLTVSILGPTVDRAGAIEHATVPPAGAHGRAGGRQCGSGRRRIALAVARNIRHAAAGQRPLIPPAPATCAYRTQRARVPRPRAHLRKDALGRISAPKAATPPAGNRASAAAARRARWAAVKRSASCFTLAALHQRPISVLPALAAGMTELFGAGRTERGRSVR